MSYDDIVMNDKHCSGCNSFDQEIIRCDDNSAKCMWLLILTMLMGEEKILQRAGEQNESD